MSNQGMQYTIWKINQQNNHLAVTLYRTVVGAGTVRMHSPRPLQVKRSLSPYPAISQLLN
jgi:hypothetical protein